MCVIRRFLKIVIGLSFARANKMAACASTAIAKNVVEEKEGRGRRAYEAECKAAESREYQKVVAAKAGDMSGGSLYRPDLDPH